MMIQQLPAWELAATIASSLQLSGVTHRSPVHGYS